MNKILIVDDEALLLQCLDKALKTDDTEVTTAETGRAALTQIADTCYQLCFLDVFLPDIDGVEVLKRIRDMSPRTKVIMMTAGIMTSNMKEIIEKNAYQFLPKPFDLLQIKMLARRALEKSLSESSPDN